jgi:hypothetical protein
VWFPVALCVGCDIQEAEGSIQVTESLVVAVEQEDAEVDSVRVQPPLAHTDAVGVADEVPVAKSLVEALSLTEGASPPPPSLVPGAHSTR